MTRHHASFASSRRTSISTSPDQRAVPAAGSPVINITPTERAGRILIGIAGIVTGFILLLSAGSVIAATLEILLVVAGLDMLVTGARGHCPLYARLGHLPRSLRSAR
jgi:hypothetical protein